MRAVRIVREAAREAHWVAVNQNRRQLAPTVLYGYIVSPFTCCPLLAIKDAGQGAREPARLKGGRATRRDGQLLGAAGRLRM